MPPGLLVRRAVDLAAGAHAVQFERAAERLLDGRVRRHDRALVGPLLARVSRSLPRSEP